MFSHVMIGAKDIDASKKFYDATLGALGMPPGTVADNGRLYYMNEAGTFAVTIPNDGNPATHANGGTIGFNAQSAEQVKAWHDAGVANGGTSCESPPGLRESEYGNFHAAYLRDPVGNKLCTIYRGE